MPHCCTYDKTCLKTRAHTFNEANAAPTPKFAHVHIRLYMHTNSLLIDAHAAQSSKVRSYQPQTSPPHSYRARHDGDVPIRHNGHSTEECRVRQWGRSGWCGVRFHARRRRWFGAIAKACPTVQATRCWSVRVYVCINIYVYIYIYTERERHESICVYLYQYICIYRERERERERQESLVQRRGRFAAGLCICIWVEIDTRAYAVPATGFHKKICFSHTHVCVHAWINTHRVGHIPESVGALHGKQALPHHAHRVDTEALLLQTNSDGLWIPPSRSDCGRAVRLHACHHLRAPSSFVQAGWYWWWARGHFTLRERERVLCMHVLYVWMMSFWPHDAPTRTEGASHACMYVCMYHWWAWGHFLRCLHTCIHAYIQTWRYQHIWYVTTSSGTSYTYTHTDVWICTCSGICAAIFEALHHHEGQYTCAHIHTHTRTCSDICAADMFAMLNPSSGTLYTLNLASSTAASQCAARGMLDLSPPPPGPMPVMPILVAARSALWTVAWCRCDSNDSCMHVCVCVVMHVCTVECLEII